MKNEVLETGVKAILVIKWAKTWLEGAKPRGPVEGRT